MKNILVIDDEEEICKCVRDLLEREYKVFTALTGNDGLNILKKEEISLLILDYKLPDTDGLKVLNEIRKTHKIPVIIITAHGDREVILKSWRYQADYYFDKPFKLRDLREKVRELLKSPNYIFPFDMFGINPSQLSPDIRKALEFIGLNLANSKGNYKKITIKEISAIASITPNYFSSLFKKECGWSVNQIINRLKIEKAKEILQTGEKNIKEIALELGFKHPNNFCWLFKKLTGKCPSELKK